MYLCFGVNDAQFGGLPALELTDAVLNLISKDVVLHLGALAFSDKALGGCRYIGRVRIFSHLEASCGLEYRSLGLSKLENWPTTGSRNNLVRSGL